MTTTHSKPTAKHVDAWTAFADELEAMAAACDKKGSGMQLNIEARTYRKVAQLCRDRRAAPAHTTA